MTDEEYLERVIAVCREERAERIALFGSRARGAHQPFSDFDIAVWGLKSVRAIRDRIDALPTLFSTDVVNMETCSNAALRKEIQEHGVFV